MGIDFHAYYDEMKVPIVVLDMNCNIVWSNPARVEATGVPADIAMGRNIFDLFPDNPNDPTANGVRKLKESIARVLKLKTSDEMAIQKYDIPVPGSTTGEFEERFWAPVNFPLFDDKGNVQYIVHRVEDVTEKFSTKG